MKAVKIILIILAALFGIWLVASALLPAQFHLDRSIVISAPPSVVFDHVNNLKSWPKWSYWDELEPEAKKTYEGPESGVGSKYSWEGKKTGKGSLVITESRAPEIIKTELDFAGEGKAQSSFKFEPADGGTKVIWDFDSEAGFSQRVFMTLMMDKFLGEAYEKGLAKLKAVSESAPAQSSSIEQVHLDYQWVIVQRDTTDVVGVPATLGSLFQTIMGFVMSNNLSSNGQPLAIWHKFDPAANFVDVEAGIPILDSAAVNSGMRLIKLGGKAVKASHWGDYDKSPATYSTVLEWMKQQNITAAGPPWEVYVTDPASEADTSKWRTDIYFPI